MKLYVVRHGETDSNKEKKIMGSEIDEPLNEKGKQQAEELALRLEKERMNFDFIFSSPLKRAHQTARIIVEHLRIPIITDERLKERSYGSLSGKTWEEVQRETKRDLESIDKRLEYDYRSYGGESVEEVRSRFSQCLGEIKRNYSGKNILIVAHGGIMKQMYLLYLKINPVEIKNVEICEFEI